MQIDNIDLAARNHSRSINFGFRDPGNRRPYQVRSLTGLDADEIVASFIGYPVSTGGGPTYSLPKLLKREVVLLVGLNPDWSAPQTFSDLRDAVYRLIGACPSGQVVIRFNFGSPQFEEDDSHVVATLIARISKFEANHFVERPEIQLTISAEDYAMLEAPSYTIEESPLWVPHTAIGATAVKLVDEQSTAAHGLDAEFTFHGPGSPVATKFKMEGLGDINGLKFEVVGFNFEIGDVLHVINRPDDRQVYVSRGTSTIHLMDKVTPDSIWPIMFPGETYYTWATNQIYVYGTTSKADWTAVKWKSTYWGV